MPFLRNAWYVAGFDADLAEKPISITIMNERIALFRDSQGKAAAIQDRCPHRFVRLSSGVVIGDALQCPYHGLEFDRSGACVKQPFDEGAPAPHNCVKSYPVTERYNMVWVWMGDPAKADPALLPHIPQMEDDGFVFVRGYLPYKGNYELMADNVLDLTHVDILHKTVRVQGNDFNDFEKKVEVNGNTLTMFVWKKNVQPAGFQLDRWGNGSTRADIHSHMTWFAPCNLFLDYGVEEVGAPEGSGYLSPSGHFVTPETETTSHYWWNVGRNNRLDDEEVSRSTHASVEAIFRDEDIFMLEQQQEGIGDTGDYLGQKPVILAADVAMIRVRRMLAKMIADEQAGMPASASAPAKSAMAAVEA
jgi:phenylpropionate dioxygenase-like ring-hydroxylating dioxygenase large terminal subunit